MGGKNCVIVDADADLDEVVPALVRSAFVYAGQKCSAAARVLCHEAVHDGLIERLAGAVEVLAVGQAERLDIDVPPVIERSAQERVARYAAEAERTGRLAAVARDVPREGWFATPAVAAELPPDSPVLHEEIFGPLLAVERVRDVAEACDRVDASPFGLTGGLFARNPDTVDYVVDRSPVGNLYVNRAITGAMVAPPAVRRQPPLRHRIEGRRPGLPAPVRRPARRVGEHDAPRARGVRMDAMELHGIHHITAITGDAPANVEFYVGVLGLRMVKKTVNQDDPTVYHLFYADEAGSPGADLTFFEYPGVGRGLPGAGMVHRIAWRVGSDAALEFWEERLRGAGSDPVRTDSALRFADPEGLEHELVVYDGPDAPLHRRRARRARGARAAGLRRRPRLHAGSRAQHRAAARRARLPGPGRRPLGGPRRAARRPRTPTTSRRRSSPSRARAPCTTSRSPPGARSRRPGRSTSPDRGSRAPRR